MATPTQKKKKVELREKPNEIGNKINIIDLVYMNVFHLILCCYNKHHRLNGFNNKHLLLTGLEAAKFKTEVSAEACLKGAHSWFAEDHFSLCPPKATGISKLSEPPL